jgi:ATP-binding cassette subfamily B protein
MLHYGLTNPEVSLMSKPKSYYSLRAFFTYIQAYKLRLLVVLIAFVIANVLIAIIPIFIGKLVGVLTQPSIDTHQAYLYVAILIACGTTHDIFWRIGEFSYLKLLNPIVIAYENVLFRHTIKKPYPYFVDKFTGKVSSYITTISQEARDFMEKVYWDYIEQIVSLVTTSIILVTVNWQTGVIFMASLLLMLLIGRYTIRNSIKYEKVWTDVQSTKNGKIIDAIANFVNVKSFHKEVAETKTIEHEQSLNIAAANRSFWWSMIFWASMAFIIRNVIWPVTILFNVHLFLNHQISIAQLTTILSALLLFSSFIWDIIWNISQFSLRFARMEEAYQYLFGTINICKDQVSARPIGPLTFGSSLTFNHLSFAYPDKTGVTVLSDINITIKKGDKVGIVGKSGSGKTTLTKLLLGYYQIGVEDILIDDQPRDIQAVAQLFSYVPQDTSLFHRSIAENIAYATERRVTTEDVITAAKQAHAEEFILQIDKGYDALVGERGVKLSAGQRQRIAIARAFLDDKPLLILDEATSALDSESEILVQQALEALWKEKTVIAIAHRLSTLRHMDTILVLDNGTIAEQGSHQELLMKKGLYAQLWAHQSGGFLEE